MNAYNLRTTVAAVTLAAASLATISAAQAAWGAIAYDSTGGAAPALGWSFNFGSAAAARARALQECQAQGGRCDTVEEFVNSCAALGFGYLPNGFRHYIVTRGRSSIPDAKQRVFNLCGNTETRDCRILYTGCSG